jgi:hypothetical protein
MGRASSGTSAGAPDGAGGGGAAAGAWPNGAGRRAGAGRDWGGRAAIQRSVHDLTSLQYQRTPSHELPPSGTSRPSGRAAPHREHSATSNGRRRFPPSPVGDGSTGTGRGFTGTCSGCLTWGIATIDETCGAMTPPRGTGHEAAPVLVSRGQDGRLATFIRQARSYPSPLVACQARSYQARSSKVAANLPATQDKSRNSAWLVTDCDVTDLQSAGSNWPDYRAF